MVVRLDFPKSDNDGYIDDVVAQRQGGVNAGFFNAAKAEWKARVQAYKDASGDLACSSPGLKSRPTRRSFRTST